MQKWVAKEFRASRLPKAISSAIQLALQKSRNSITLLGNALMLPYDQIGWNNIVLLLYGKYFADKLIKSKVELTFYQISQDILFLSQYPVYNRF